jgi:glutamine phosphoribosylpyrophosphate amidotransferase
LPVSLPLFPQVDAAAHADYEKKEKCGLFGVWGTDEAARLAYRGLFAQQHRGQESAGIAVADGTGTLKGHA